MQNISIEVVSSDSTNLKIQKEDLINLVIKYEDKTFSEDLDYLESLGGEEKLKLLLNVDSDKGLEPNSIDWRRAKYGSNKKKDMPARGFFEILKGIMTDLTLRLLLISSGISIVANTIVEERHRDTAWIEGFAIFLTVAISATVQAANEFQKERQFKKLQEFANAKKKITVYRGQELEIHPDELVTGDVIKITEGMDIPADILVIEAHEISTDESAMTGESELIKKNNYKEALQTRDKLKEHKAEGASHHAVPSIILLSGTKIQTGAGKGIVVVVGDDSCIGRIQSYLVQEVYATPLQQKLETVAKNIGKFGLTCAIMVLLILIIRFLVDRAQTDTWGDGEKWLKMINYLILAITVVVVAIPEGLPLAVTISIAYSIKKMLQDKNLVKTIQATETMGGANCICSDKTGTLTQNKMTLTDFWNGRITSLENYEEKSIKGFLPNEEHAKLVKLALGCNGTATLGSQDGSKTEIALLEFLVKINENYETLRQTYLPKDSLIFPFTSFRKRMSVITQDPTTGLKQMHLKGASEIVLASCNQFYDFTKNEIIPLDAQKFHEINDLIEFLASQALRTLCIAYKPISGTEDFTTKDEKGVLELEKNDFILIGVLGIRDIIRKEVPEAVAKCKKAGIKVRMVTGDNKITAAAIAKQCGILDPDQPDRLVLEGTEFHSLVGGIVCKNCRLNKDCNCPRTKSEASKMKLPVRVDTIANAQEFDKIIGSLDVLARSRPDDKYALVTGLMERGMIVAVTGDGTNDAPALKKSDVGFAMNSGTAVSKEAADIILIDDNFASIVEAVKWGRNIYDSIKKFLQFQLAVNMVAVTSTVVTAAVLREPSIRAVNMLWINIIMDSLASLAISTEPPNEDLLSRKPHKKNESMVSRTMMKHIIGQAIFQFCVIMVLVFTADKWIPESMPHIIDPELNLDVYYDESHGEFVRSGRAYFISDSSDDYARFEVKYGPSRHYTIIFNTFVCSTIFNFINARSLRDEINVFKGITRNNLFPFIFLTIVGLQVLIVEASGRAFNCSNHGLSIIQWLICIGLGSLALIWSVVLKVIPIKRLCPKFGDTLTDPIEGDIGVLKLRRHNLETVLKQYSNMSHEVLDEGHRNHIKVQRRKNSNKV